MTEDLQNRIIGMLMHFFGLVNDPETRTAVQKTISEVGALKTKK